MLHLIRFFFTLLLSTLPILAASAFSPPADRQEADSLCKELPLLDYEGVWHYPTLDLDVFILHEGDDIDQANIWIVESTNCKLPVGTKLGYLKRSADPDKFHLTLFTSIGKSGLSSPHDCTATLSRDRESIAIDKRKFKFRFDPFGFLPYSIKRVFKFSTENPQSKLKDGMYKVFPSYDHNGSRLRSPRYL